VLIGHSFGGLVLKRLIVELKKASTIGNPTDSLSETKVHCVKEFLSNVRGVVFYAIPHVGSRNFVEYVNNRHHLRIMDNMQP
jgi:triacylglycerol esterase/lipase EstA (alpha/beta hydrolase family)